MDDLIYCQRNIPPREHPYGLRPSAKTGCGWIAVYNALRLLGYTTDIDDLIRYLLRLLPLIHGTFGTSFWAPALCFRNWGFPVKLVFNPRRYDRAAREADACVLFYHWRRKLRFGAHFVALRHTPQGFVGYNTYRNSTGPDRYGESLYAFLRRQGWFGTVLITIRQKS